MYGKIFESMYEGSMYGAGAAVFAVWGYVIAKTRDSRIELHPKRLADTLGAEVDDINAAIEFLTKPDPISRHKEHDGRRLIKEGQFQYFVPTWAEYRKIRNEDERREYNRLKQAEYRQRKSIGAPRNGSPLPGENLAVRAMGDGDTETADHIAANSYLLNRPRPALQPQDPTEL